MKYNITTLILLFAGLAWSMDSLRSPTPPLGHSGVHVDDNKDVVMSYGNHPDRGIPQHAYHVESNFAKHPGNADAFPVNRAGQQAKKELRGLMIDRKQGIPGHSKDHKPPNVQDMPGLTPQQRKDRTTVKNLPTSESNKEWDLAGKGWAAAMKPGTSGKIRLNPHIDPNIPRPASEASTLNSVPGGASRLPRPVKSTSNVPAGTPHITRAGTQFAGARPAAFPVTPAGRIQPIVRPADSPGTPASRIPRPIPRPAGGLTLPFRLASPQTPTPAPRDRPSGSGSGSGTTGPPGRILRKRSSEALVLDKLINVLQRRYLASLDADLGDFSVLAY